MKKTKSLYRGPRFPASFIGHAGRRCFRFRHGLRDIRERPLKPQSRVPARDEAQLPPLARAGAAAARAQAPRTWRVGADRRDGSRLQQPERVSAMFKRHFDTSPSAFHA